MLPVYPFEELVTLNFLNSWRTNAVLTITAKSATNSDTHYLGLQNTIIAILIMQQFGMIQNQNVLKMFHKDFRDIEHIW